VFPLFNTEKRTPVAGKNSLFFELARLLVRLNHIASVIVNADQGMT